jgi:hypothetical protein
MTKSQLHSNKAPQKPKRAAAMPTLGVALNWVPPKAPVSTPARKRKPLPDTQ